MLLLFFQFADNGENMVIGVAATDVYDSKTVFQTMVNLVLMLLLPEKEFFNYQL